MRYHMTNSSEGRSTIVLIDDDGDTAVITDSHPNYVRIADAVLNGQDPSQWLEGSSDWFEGEYLDDFTTDEEDEDYADDFEPAAAVEGLADTIARYRREGRDADNLVRFMRRLAKNPSFRSREQLFTWATGKDLTIDSEGYVIGYKGVSSDMLSQYSGTALVDGVEHTGQIPNFVGTVVSMPRSEVQDDFRQGCSYGLHIGTWDYASSWGPVVLEVRIDPADVVSVPSDSSYAKLRCCEYEIIAVHETDVDDLSDYEPEATFDDDAAWDEFATVIPQGFLARLRDRVSRKGKS